MPIALPCACVLPGSSENQPEQGDCMVALDDPFEAFAKIASLKSRHLVFYHQAVVPKNKW
jgi:hypothetical protein